MADDTAASPAKPGDPPRACRYGHGPLAIEPGHWCLARLTATSVKPGEVYGFRLAVCQVCGYVEMFDDGSELQP